MYLLCALDQFSHRTDTMNKSSSSRQERAALDIEFYISSWVCYQYVTQYGFTVIHQSSRPSVYFLEVAPNFQKSRSLHPISNASISIPWILSFHSFPSKDVVRQFCEYASEFIDREVFGRQSYRHLSRSVRFLRLFGQNIDSPRVTVIRVHFIFVSDYVSETDARPRLLCEPLSISIVLTYPSYLGQCDNAK